VSISRAVAPDEVVQVFALERIRFQREVLVGSEVVSISRWNQKRAASPRLLGLLRAAPVESGNREKNAPDIASSAPVESPLFTRVVMAAVVCVQSILG
jgi:hypothetical protein